MIRPPQSIHKLRVWVPVALLLALVLHIPPLHAAPNPQREEPTTALVVGYAEAAAWLDRLPVEDREDQIRDYAIVGLASLLGLDLPALRNALYDQTPVRDPLFWDLATNRSGPGRGLFDGGDTLHVLVPQDDLYAARTIGLVLDDHRKDTGTDPAQVVLYRYTIDHAGAQVHLKPEPPQATADVRQAYGYVEIPIRNLADLERFLSRTQHLAQVVVRDGTLRAGGWNWPGVPTGRVTAEDLTVLQRGYLAARGEPLTGEQFISQDLAGEYGLDTLVTDEVKAHAHELDTFFTAWENAGTNDEYVNILTEYEALVLDVILPDAIAARLERGRAGKSEIAWFDEYADAFLAEMDRNELWGALWYVASGALDRPDPGATEPGFSLDPGPPLSLEELLALLPVSLYPELAGRHPEVLGFVEGYLDEMEPEAFGDFLDEYEGFILEVVLDEQASQEALSLLATLETTRSQAQWREASQAYLDLIYSALRDQDRPWPLLMAVAVGQTPYQYARYDGGLAGTEAGMTYFYTDILAKGYFYELGQGTPYGIVDGFLPESHSTAPWSHCTLEDEQGRIWFGLREEAVGLFPEQVNLGSVATRVFVLAQDPVHGEQEIEPSYMFGQGIWWWDRHYQAMADYEPQYHRLDQLMRWGAALAWLVDQGEALLPTVPGAQIEEGWRFDAWLQAHPELTWQYEIPFVEVPGQPAESVLRLFSQPYEQCGKRWVSSGGISNPDLARIAEIAENRPDLPQSVARAGLDAAATDFSEQLMAGTIAGLDGIRRTLEPIEAGGAVVEVAAQGRKVWSLGEVKVALPETAERRLKTALSGTDKQVTWQMEVQDLQLGALTSHTDGTSAAVRWDEGPLARAQALLDKVQELLLEYALDLALDMLDGETPVFLDEEGEQYYLQLDTGEDKPRWLVISTQPPHDADALSFRLARPVDDGETAAKITWYYASLIEQPPPDAEPLR